MEKQKLSELLFWAKNVMKLELYRVQCMYPARSICTVLVSETSRLKSFGQLYSTTAI